LNWRNSRSTTREKYIFSKVEKERPLLLKISPQAVSTSEEAALENDFVPLALPKGTKRKRRADDPDSDVDERDYRSIRGKTKPENVPSDEDLRYATESDSSGSEAGYVPTFPLIISSISNDVPSTMLAWKFVRAEGVTRAVQWNCPFVVCSPTMSQIRGWH